MQWIYEIKIGCCILQVPSNPHGLLPHAISSVIWGVWEGWVILFTCKTDGAGAPTLSRKGSTNCEKWMKTTCFRNYPCSFSLSGRKTLFSWKLTLSTRVNVVIPDCYHRHYALLNNSEIKPLTKSFPTIHSITLKERTFLPQLYVLLVFLVFPVDRQHYFKITEDLW